MVSTALDVVRGEPAVPRRPAALRLTERDGAVLRDLTRFYGLTVEQVARRHFGAAPTAHHRLQGLARAGYIALRRPWYRGPGVYVATAAGARLAAVGLPAAPFRTHAIAHHLAVADLTEVLLQGRPGATWVAERELRRDGMATVRDRRDGRLLGGPPHVPDGVLVLSDAPVAVELELATKKQSEYERIFRWYGAALAYRRVVWFVAAAALRRRLGDLLARERLDDFMTVEPLPAGVRVPTWG